jgi:hypothetical protein
LLVAGIQIGDAALEARFAGLAVIDRHHLFLFDAFASVA